MVRTGRPVAVTVALVYLLALFGEYPSYFYNSLRRYPLIPLRGIPPARVGDPESPTEE